MHSTLFLLNVCVFCFCSICFLLFFNSGNLTIEENSSSRAGLKSDLSIHCSACDESTPWQTSPNITKKENLLMSTGELYIMQQNRELVLRKTGF